MGVRVHLLVWHRPSGKWRENRVALLGRGKRKAEFAGNLVRAAGGGIAIARVQFRVRGRTWGVPMAQGKAGAAPCGACRYV